jgi:hypothetical protein
MQPAMAVITDSAWGGLIARIRVFDPTAAAWLNQQPADARIDAIIDLLVTSRKKISLIVSLVRRLERENVALRERARNYSPVRLLN